MEYLPVHPPKRKVIVKAIAFFTLIFCLNSLSAQYQIDVKDGTIHGQTSKQGQTAIQGESDTGYGVQGISDDSRGVTGYSKNSLGVFGVSENFYGISGSSTYSAAGFFHSLQPDMPDIILGGTGSSGFKDDGILSSQPFWAGSDLILTSNDAVSIQLDHNNDQNSYLLIKNGAGNNVAWINESGNMWLNGTVNQGSNRHHKEQILPISKTGILESLVDLPIYEWQYRSDSARHVGPMAQDFYHQFQLGADSTHIASLDIAGISLAGVQALAEVVVRQKERLAIFQSTHTVLEQEVSALRLLVEKQAADIKKLQDQLH